MRLPTGQPPSVVGAELDRKYLSCMRVSHGLTQAVLCRVTQPNHLRPVPRRMTPWVRAVPKNRTAMTRLAMGTLVTAPQDAHVPREGPSRLRPSERVLKPARHAGFLLCRKPRRLRRARMSRTFAVSAPPIRRVGCNHCCCLNNENITFNIIEQYHFGNSPSLPAGTPADQTRDWRLQASAANADARGASRCVDQLRGVDRVYHRRGGFRMLVRWGEVVQTPRFPRSRGLVT